jgi:hypothetical protein
LTAPAARLIITTADADGLRDGPMPVAKQWSHQAGERHKRVPTEVASTLGVLGVGRRLRALGVSDERV